MPVFAQQAPQLVQAAAMAAPASTSGFSVPGQADALAQPDRPLPLPDRALMVAGDFHRWMGSQPTPTSQPATSSRIQSVLQHALALLGTPYRWGGVGTQGFDCSGLVGYVFQSALGIELPRVSRDMASTGQLISDRANLSPGDLVFFGHHGRVSHVGIYVGEGRFVHAPRTGRDVTVSSLESGYWSDKYLEARRVAGI
ncbi:MAG: nlpC/P60 family protein [Xanthomonadaceae bacterium]|nr:nlpC/P60 family protein [Xanthomonadaceae bacterium]